MFGTTTKLSMVFQVLGFMVVACTLERILYLEQGLPLTEINIEINIKKVIHAVVNAVHKYYILITRTMSAVYSSSGSIGYTRGMYRLECHCQYRLM